MIVDYFCGKNRIIRKKATFYYKEEPQLAQICGIFIRLKLTNIFREMLFFLHFYEKDHAEVKKQKNLIFSCPDGKFTVR